MYGMNDGLLCLGQKKWSNGETNVRGTTIYPLDNKFCSIGHFYSCIHTTFDEETFTHFETIDEFLTVLDGNNPNWKVTNYDGWKENNGKVLTDQMINALNINECCISMQQFVKGKFKGSVIIDDMGMTSYLLENIKELINEIRQVNNIAKENNVKFVMF